MEKLIFKTMIPVLIVACLISCVTHERQETGARIPMPPPVVFSGSPHVVVIPGTYVYVIPDIEVDFFFFEGWWWRPWQGRWYRSRDYRSGWHYYHEVPSFYRDVPPGWRKEYQQNRWKGHQWEHQRLPHEQVEKEWNKWEKDKHWEKQNNWGIRNQRPETESGRSYDQDQQQELRDRQRYGTDPQPDDRDRKRSRDAVEPERYQPQQSEPRQKGHDKRKKQENDDD